MLRYLSDAYKALRQTVPDEAKTEDLTDLIEWLGETGPAGRLQPARRVGAAAQPGWTRRSPARDERPAHGHGQRAGVPGAGAQRDVPPGRAGRARALRGARRARLGRAAGTPRRWEDALEAYFDEHDEIGTGSDARGPALLMIDQQPGQWAVRQIFDDPAGDHDWGISAVVDLDASDEAGSAVLRITDVGQLSGF